MSTKIYYAWRCRCRMFYLVLADLRAKAFAHAVKRMKDEIRDLKKLPEPFERCYKMFLKEKKQSKDTPTLRKLFEVRAAMALAQNASRSPERMSPCDIDASLNVWVHMDQVYVIGYGDCWNYLPDYVPPGAEDYAYWDNVEQPADVTHQQWRQRGKNWETVAFGGKNWDSCRLVHEIINAKDDVGLHELSDILLPKANSLMVVP